VNVTIPKPGDDQVSIEIDKGNGAQAQLRHTLALSRTGGEVVSVTGFSDTPKAQRLRGIARFLHTGEILGFWGQTIAGLGSLAALFLVWTGFALSWRRLIQPLFARRAGR
ncbi:MAG TPA: PepSY-associated TM helix domain-containing protein, partial [Hyphomicrobiales bacterium]|nr:PepSY-associated TM helix domain-containing protein [Hyphomicrobiales bacterium]